LPKDKQKAAYGISPNIPSVLQQQREKFLDHVMTGGKAWIPYSKGKAKKQSVVQ
jgi:hypothetical protein